MKNYQLDRGHFGHDCDAGCIDQFCRPRGGTTVRPVGPEKLKN